MADVCGSCDHPFGCDDPEYPGGCCGKDGRGTFCCYGICETCVKKLEKVDG
jgi:hypothetical protein